MAPTGNALQGMRILTGMTTSSYLSSNDTDPLGHQHELDAEPSIPHFPLLLTISPS